MVKNGPAELSFPPSSPMTTGGFSHVIHQVSVPTPRDLPGIYFIIPKDACNINIYVRLGTPESWGTGAQL